MLQWCEPGQVAAIDFGGSKVAVATGDGKLHAAAPFPPSSKAQDVLNLAVELVTHIGVTAPRVVSISTPGGVSDDAVSFAPNVSGWSDVHLGQWADRVWHPTTIHVTNDVDSACLAEVELGALRDIDVGLYLNLGTGIAAAICVDGKVLRGAHGLGGEIGYALPGPAEFISWHSGRAQLEQVAGGVGLRNAGIRIPMDADESWFQGSDGASARMALDELARHVATAVLLLDPRRVVVGGGLSRVQAVISHLTTRLNAVALAPPEVRVSEFAEGASVLGALAIGSRK